MIKRVNTVFSYLTSLPATARYVPLWSNDSDLTWL